MPSSTRKAASPAVASSRTSALWKIMEALLLRNDVWIIRDIPNVSAREQRLQFSIKNVQPGRTGTGCVAVGVFDSRKLSAAAAMLDRSARGALTAVLQRGDIEGKSGSTLLLHD